MDIPTLKQQINELKEEKSEHVTVSKEVLLQLMEEVLQWRRSSIARARRGMANRQEKIKNE